MRDGDAHAGERASLLFARADEDVEARAPLARGERASSRPSRAQCAAAAVVAILGASAVTGASRSHLPRLGSRNAVRRVADARAGSDAAATSVTDAATASPRAPSASSADRASASLGAVSASEADVGSPTDLASATRARAAETGFALEVSEDAKERYADWIQSLVVTGNESNDDDGGSRTEPRIDRFFENVVARGADALPDVAPGVPFDAFDDAYDAVGWAHAPARLRLDFGESATLGVSDEERFAPEGSLSALRASAERERLGKEEGKKQRRNAFSVCVDRARDWDVAFPEGWFQTFASGTLAPGYCVSEVILDESESSESEGWPCADADVVLFDEGAFIWRGAHRASVVGDDGETREEYVVPAKRSPDQVYVYFAHESPALFGSELLDRRFTDQFDYLASPNKRGASAWWSFAPSARHVVQDFVAFSRPFANRAPALAWLSIDCGHERQGILGEIAEHYPVWSLGPCGNNKAASEDLPGRDARSDEQRRRMQLALSQHLFYFSAENSACPGYTTEKMWMALTRGSVPVYYGDGEYKKYLPCYDAGSNTAPCVLDVRDFPTAAALAERMREIARDEAEYARVTEWRFRDPRTWPEPFRAAVAAASADVTRVTCGLLRGDGSGNKVKPALAQVAATGGWVGATAAAEAATGSFYAAAYGVTMTDLRDDFENSKSSKATDSNDVAVRAAAEAFRDGKSPDAGLVRRLGAAHCGRANDFPVFGRAPAEYAKRSTDAPFADPESHYDRLCADDARAACFRLKEPL